MAEKFEDVDNVFVIRDTLQKCFKSLQSLGVERMHVRLLTANLKIQAQYPQKDDLKPEVILPDDKA